MSDIGVIDRFLDTFTTYIDSGFGLLGTDVHFLTATLIGIDITLAGLYWALGPDTNVIAKFLKKVMYVGVFALIITNFSYLANVVFDSFGALGLKASGTSITAGDLMRPGFIAATGFEAAHPLLIEVGDLTGPVKFFTNFVTIAVLMLAWLITIFAFFFVAIQLFVTVIEFKLTTLAGFILIPFALWNKTSFLAEKVMGNVVASGVKLMVLAVIVGIGSTIFGEITSAFVPGEVTLEDAAAVMLGSLAILALAIFGPGIATGLVSGAPQLGAGAAVGTMAAAGAGAYAAGAAGMASGRAGSKSGGAAVKAGASLAGGANMAFTLGKAASGKTGASGAVAGASAMAQAAGGAIKNAAKGAASKATAPVNEAYNGGLKSGLNALSQKGLSTAKQSNDNTPDWAKQVKSQQRRAHATNTAHHTLRSGDRPGGGASPSLTNDDE